MSKLCIILININTLAACRFVVVFDYETIYCVAYLWWCVVMRLLCFRFVVLCGCETVVCQVCGGVSL